MSEKLGIGDAFLNNTHNLFSKGYFDQEFISISSLLLEHLLPQPYKATQGLFSRLKWDNVRIFYQDTPLISPLQVQTWHASIQAAHGEVFVNQVKSFYLIWKLIKNVRVTRVFVFGMNKIFKKWLVFLQIPEISKLNLIKEPLQNALNIQADLIILNGENNKNLQERAIEIAQLREKNIQGRIRYEGQERVLYEMSLEGILLIPELEDLEIVDDWNHIEHNYTFNRKYRRDDLIVFFHILNSYEQEARGFTFEGIYIL